MKILSKLMVLIIGLSAFTTLAQKADSVIVIYDNQKTVIPVPAFGSLTTVKYSDSTQVIEIGVSRLKPNDNYSLRLTPFNSTEVANPQRTRKWFSQIEVGFTLGYVRSENLYYPIDSLDKTTYEANLDRPMGYNLGVSVCDKERKLNDKYSYISGFKLGYSQYFREAMPKPATSDTNIVFYGFDRMRENHLKFLVPFGIRYHFINSKNDAQINFGANLGYLLSLYKCWPDDFSTIGSGSAVLTLNPFVELQISQFGFLFSTEFYAPGTDIMKSSMGFSITYRLY